jgi:CheY-like chemotaxis protein
LHFSIRDTGIGIPPEKQSNLFAAFSQADSSTTRKYGGTGLGLAICRKLVELMRGQIWVDSEEGQGSDFQFTISQQVVADTRSSQNEDSQEEILRGKKALLIDDNETNLKILSRQLSIWGIESTPISSSPTGVEMALQNEYDFAIVDYEMPVWNGVETSIRIREARSKQELPIIFLGSAYPDISEEQKENLFNAYFMKPARHSLLQKALTRILSQSKSRFAKQVPKGTPEVLANDYPLQILLAEDNAVNQKMASLALEKMGYMVDSVANGLEAVEAAHRQVYDLIFMDVQMPELDGVEATKRIQKELGDQSPCIVAMTANAMDGDRERLLDSGMDDYISKPINLEALRSIIVKFGRAKQQKESEQPQI